MMVVVSQGVLVVVIVDGSAMCLLGWWMDSPVFCLLRRWVGHDTKTFSIIYYTTIWNETNLSDWGRCDWTCNLHLGQYKNDTHQQVTVNV